MKYFGHDSDAGDDAKLQLVILKFNIMGYGVYFRCLELIASKLNENKMGCVLEQNLVLLERLFNIPQEKIKEILDYFVEVGLFDLAPDGKYRNLKLLRRIDEYTQKRLRRVSRECPDSVRLKEKKTKEIKYISNSSSTKDSATKDKKREPLNPVEV